jgi:hypothetical protein
VGGREGVVVGKAARRTTFATRDESSTGSSRSAFFFLIRLGLRGILSFCRLGRNRSNRVLLRGILYLIIWLI